MNYKLKLQSRIDNIQSLIKEYPERHFFSIIATTGLTFHDDLNALYQYSKDTAQPDICELLEKYTSCDYSENTNCK